MFLNNIIHNIIILNVSFKYVVLLKNINNITIVNFSSLNIIVKKLFFQTIGMTVSVRAIKTITLVNRRFVVTILLHSSYVRLWIVVKSRIVCIFLQQTLHRRMHALT